MNSLVAGSGKLVDFYMEVCLPTRCMSPRGVKLFGGLRYVTGEEVKKLLKKLIWGYLDWFMIIIAHHRRVSMKYRYEYANILRHHGHQKQVSKFV